MGQTVEERPGGDNHGAGLHRSPVAQHDPGHAAVPADRKRGYLRLPDTQIGFVLKHFPHPEAVQFLVHLRARRPHRRTARGIQQAELYAGRIGQLAHHAAQSVDLAHQVTLGDAADGRVAAHLRHQVQVHGDHGGAQANPRAGARRFTAGVAGADDNDVVPVGHWYHCTRYEDTRYR